MQYDLTSQFSYARELNDQRQRHEDKRRAPTTDELRVPPAIQRTAAQNLNRLITQAEQQEARHGNHG